MDIRQYIYSYRTLGSWISDRWVYLWRFSSYTKYKFCSANTLPHIEPVHGKLVCHCCERASMVACEYINRVQICSYASLSWCYTVPKCYSLVKAWHSNIVQGFRKHVIYKQKARSGKKETQFKSNRIEKGSKREKEWEGVSERQQKQSSCFVHIYKWHGRNCVGYVHGTNSIEFNCDNICIIQYLLRFRQIHTVFISLRKFILRLNILAPI